MLALTPVYDDEPLSVSQLVYIPHFTWHGVQNAMIGLSHALFKDQVWIDSWSVTPPFLFFRLGGSAFFSSKEGFIDSTTLQAIRKETRKWVIGSQMDKVVTVRRRYLQDRTEGVLEVGKCSR